MKKAAKNTLAAIAKILGLAPLGLLFIIVAGNTSPTCGEVEPLEPVCSEASECDGLPHIMCEGGWGCEDGQCIWECDAPAEDFCSSDNECADGEYCTVSDGDCIVMEGQYEDGPMTDVALCHGVCKEKPVKPDNCNSDADCDAGQMCEIFDCLSPDCDEDEPCLGYCEPIGNCVEIPQPGECESDEDCGKGMMCQIDVLCWNSECDCVDQDVPCNCGGLCEAVGHCVPMAGDCLSDAQCAKGQKCQLEEMCYMDEDCECDDQFWGPCDCSGMCEIIGYCVDEEPMGECLHDADCGPAEYCHMDLVCEVSCNGDCYDNEGDWCGTEECYEVGYCMPLFEGDCQEDADCPEGSSCLVACAAPLCIETEEADCPPPACYGECVPDEPIQCYSDYDCSKKEVCVDSLCVPFICADQACPPGFELDVQICECVELPNPCVVSGCSGEVCAVEPMVTECIDEPWLVCFQPEFTTCGPYGPNGSCMFEPTAAFHVCLQDFFME